MGISENGCYDAVIIGSGLGGLSCALHLARAGLKVAVLEKQPKAGGYCQNYSRGDYIFDVSLHILPALHPGEGLHRLLEDMGLLDRLEYREHQPMFRSIYPDREYRIPGGRDAALDYLKQTFPEESDSLEAFFRTIGRMVEDNARLFMTGEVDFDQFFPAEYYGRSYGDLLDEFFSNPRLKSLLGQLWQSTGLPDRECSANWGVEVNGWHLLSGNFYIRGGGGRMASAMISVIEENNGVVLVNSLVNRIRLDGRRVVGAETVDGRLFDAPLVISNANPFQTYLSLIGEEKLSSAYLDKIRKLRPSCSLLTLYIGLDCPAANIGIGEHTLFINSGDDNSEAYRMAMEEKFEHTDYMISNYSDDDGGVHPPGRGIIQVAEVAPGESWVSASRPEYEDRKARVQEQILRKVCSRFPNLRDHIVECELATPRTLMQTTRNPLGSVYGFAQIPSQADNSRFGSSTSFRGLYFTGAWCRGGGGGYMGSIINGRVCSRQILKSRESS